MKNKLLLLWSLTCILALQSQVVFAANYSSARTSNIVLSHKYSDSFRGRSPKLESLGGRLSSVYTMRPPHLYGSSVVKKVEAYVSVERGSSPFYVVVRNANGNIGKVLVKQSGYYSIPGDFIGKDAKGDWQVYIEGNGYRSSQGTVTVTVHYEVNS